MGVQWFRPETETKNACRGWSMASLKSITKLRADNTDSILAEAEYIFNNASEFLGGVEEEYLLAA